MSEQGKFVNTADDVIDALGGNSKVAELVGLKPNAVGMWRVRGLPPETFLILTTALNAIGLSAPPVLWRMRGEPQELQNSEQKRRELERALGGPHQ